MGQIQNQVANMDALEEEAESGDSQTNSLLFPKPSLSGDELGALNLPR